MKVSVVVATYNGGKYVYEQLNSIKEQSCKPDEVIICDDGSTDNTIDIIESFIKRLGHGNNWKLVRNGKRLGYAANFYEGVKRASNDIVFFSDQDDVWEYNKIKLLKDIFEHKENALAVICNQKYIDDNGKEISNIVSPVGIEDVSSNFARFIYPNIEKVDFDTQVNRNRATGMAMAVKRLFALRYMGLIYKYKIGHDLILGLIAAACGGMYYCRKALVRRRVHACNTSAPMITLKDRSGNIEKHIDGRIGRLKLMNICLKELKCVLQIGELKRLEDALNKMERNIICIYKNDYIGLMKLLISRNSMINKRIVLFDIIIAVKNVLGCKV